MNLPLKAWRRPVYVPCGQRALVGTQVPGGVRDGAESGVEYFPGKAVRGARDYSGDDHQSVFLQLYLGLCHYLPALFQEGAPEGLSLVSGNTELSCYAGGGADLWSLCGDSGGGGADAAAGEGGDLRIASERDLYSCL